MNPPLVEVIPARNAVCNDATVTIDVLVRITPRLPEVHFPRPGLNLALVLDRSGSMAAARKMEYARQAAIFAVEQLLPTDRISVTLFDDQIETIVPATPVLDKPAIVRRIASATPRGSTDLYGGWVQGVRQTETGLVPGGINRVLLLSDGRANVGVTDPNILADEVRGFTARGIGTSTLGVGDDYNEDLMEAIALAGDGNYYFIESPAQLMDLFQSELHGLMVTSGQKVSLGLEAGEGVTIVDVLNDFDKLDTGRHKLPNLVLGMPIPVVIRLSVPARKMAGTLLNLRLAWDDPRVPERQVIRERLGGLPALPRSDWEALEIDESVREHEALLMAARAQKEASLAHERGDMASTLAWLSHATESLSAIPQSLAVTEEMAATSEMMGTFDTKGGYFRKFSKYRAHNRRQGKSGQQPTPPDNPPK